MNNFDVGRDIVDRAMKVYGRRRTRMSPKAALALLDRVCDKWRHETPEFESRDPANPSHVNPNYLYDTEPAAAFAALLRDAFWPELSDEKLKHLGRIVQSRDDDVTDEEHRLGYDWYLRVEYAFERRFGWAGPTPGPQPYCPPIREADLASPRKT